MVHAADDVSTYARRLLRLAQRHPIITCRLLNTCRDAFLEAALGLACRRARVAHKAAAAAEAVQPKPRRVGTRPLLFWVQLAEHLLDLHHDLTQALKALLIYGLCDELRRCTGRRVRAAQDHIDDGATLMVLNLDIGGEGWCLVLSCLIEAEHTDTIGCRNTPPCKILLDRAELEAHLAKLLRGCLRRVEPWRGAFNDGDDVPSNCSLGRTFAA